jgi:hypothetical protein
VDARIEGAEETAAEACQEKVRLSHYSDKRLGEIRPGIQAPHFGRPMFSDKPRGLWVSVDGPDDWPSYCADNMNRALTYRYKIVLKKSARLLHLSTRKQLLGFERKYSTSDGLTSMPAIAWSRVAERYQGIIIAPYQWSARMDLMWYYTWDCASGCIWDVSVIHRVEFKPAAPSVSATPAIRSSQVSPDRDP